MASAYRSIKCFSVDDMYKLYEVRRVGKHYQIIHLRSGYAVERGIKYKSYADALCARFNQCL